MALDDAGDNLLINNVMPGGAFKLRMYEDTAARLRRGEVTGPGFDTEGRRPLGWGNP